MSKKKDDSHEVNSWLAKVPRALQEAVERKRNRMGHNKKTAVEYALGLYLQAPLPVKPTVVSPDA